MRELKFLVLNTLLPAAFLILLAYLLSACGHFKGDVGQPGAPGAGGVSGEKGEKGDQGNQGVAGTPSLPVTSVQLCKSVGSTVYPTTFPEQVLCVSQELYGVYWDGSNAWLAKLPVGRYESTATNLKCTFDIKPNCVVEEIL